MDEDFACMVYRVIDYTDGWENIKKRKSCIVEVLPETNSDV